MTDTWGTPFQTVCVCPAFCTEVITLTRDLEGPAEFRQGSITPFTHTRTKSSRPALFVSNNRYVLPLTHKYRHTPTAKHQQWKQTPLPWFLLKISPAGSMSYEPSPGTQERERERPGAWHCLAKIYAQTHSLASFFSPFTTLFCLPLLFRFFLYSK